MNKNNPIKNKTLSRFSIRKCSVGTASFLIGTVAFFGIHHEAFAAENSTAPVTVTQLKENPSQNTVDSSASTEATNTNTQAPTDVQSPSQSNPEQSSPATQATETTETTNPSDGTQTADSSNNKTEPSADANKVDTNTSTDTANGQSKEQQETTPLSESQPTTTSEQSNTTTSPQTNTQELPSTENTNTTPTTQAASAEQPTESTPQSGENANIQNVNTINTPASPSQLTKIEGTTQARALDATTTQPTAAGGSNVNDKVTASNIKTTESYIEPNNSGSFYLRTQFTVNGDVKEGDYFTVTMPETVNIYGDTRYHSDDRESLKSADGQVIAIGTYDVPTHKMTYTFTNVVNNLTNVTGSFNLTQFMDRKAAPNSQVYPLKYDVAGESFETNLDVYYGKYYNYKDSNLKSMITMEDTKTGDYEQYIYVNPLKMTATDSVVRVQGFQKDPTASNGQLNQQNSKIQIFKVNDNQNLNSSFGVNDGDYQDVTNQFNITYYNKDNVADINFGTLNGARYIVKVTSKEVADSKADLQLRSIMYTKNAYNQYDTITWDNDILKSASSGTADGTEALYNLGDKVWNDVNKNGIQDAGEVGIPNVKVTLKDSNGTVIATTETNTNGKYVFNKLKNGVYYVDFETPANYTPTVANQENDALDSDGPLRAPAIISDGNNLTVDQGFYLTETPKYNVGDKVWEDSNKNGIQDADEKGISGVTVTLKDTDGNIVGTQVTDANGNYLFEKVAEGEYHIDFTTPEGYTPTITGQGPVENDSNGVSTNLIVAGQDDLTIDSGFYRPTYNVGDKVWEDSNKDGIQQDNEKGISGVTVTLKDTAGNVIGTQVTDANGNYLFDNVNDGEYKIEFTT
ncbi:SdrD B-like domain-containing protein, partial [Staphylococcus lutrae]